MNQKLRAAVNVAIVILVPLINERQKIQRSPEFIKAKDTALTLKDKAVDTGSTIAEKSVTLKDNTVKAGKYAAEKTQELKEKNAQLKEQRAEKKEEKQVQKMDKKLQKEIAGRRKEEAQALKSRQHDLKKAIQEADKKERKKTAEEVSSTQFVMQQVRKTESRANDDTKNIKLLNNEKVNRNDIRSDYSNDTLFEKHRAMMTQHIESR